MAPRLFCGAFQPALEDAFCERLESLRPGPGRRVMVVAPSRRMAERLERLIAFERGLGFLELRVHTFYSLALEILTSCGPEPWILAADAQIQELLVRGLLTSSRSLSRGLAGAYSSSLKDLADAGVDPESLRLHFAEWFEEPQRSLLNSLLELLQAYERRRRETGLASSFDLVQRATRVVEEGRENLLGGYQEILYYGFYDLTGAQADFFNAVAGAYPCSVFFPYVKGYPAFKFVERFYELRLSRGSGARHLPPDWGGRALGEGLGCLFNPGRQASLPEGRLRLINVSGSRDEVWATAKGILAAREEDPSLSFDEIGVVARSLEPYRALLAEVFEENEIPFSMEEGEPLLRHPLAKLALNLLNLARMDFPASAVQDLLRSPYLRVKAFGSAQRQESACRVIAALGIHSGWSQWEGIFGAQAGRDPDSKAIWEWLSSLRQSLRVASPPSWAGASAHWMTLLQDHFHVPVGDPAAGVWEAMLAATQELATFDRAAAGADYPEMLEALERRWRGRAIPAPDRRGVRVLGAMDARGHSFRRLFLIGLQEGVFPRQVREDPLLPDDLRARLAHPAGYWIRPKLEGYDEERLLFALLVSSASERLVCVYQRSDDAGRATVPSSYLRELCRACGVDFSGEANRRVPRQPLVKVRESPLLSWSPDEMALAACAAGSDPAPALSALGEEAGALAEVLRRSAELNRQGGPGPMDGVVGPPRHYLRRYRARGRSPSELQEYTRCPFRFFMSRVLQIPEPEEAAQRGALSAERRGRLYHAALRRFHSRLGESGYWSAQAADWVPVLEEAIEAEMGAASWKTLGLYPVLWEAIRRTMTEYLREFVSWDLAELRRSGFKPARFEEEVSCTVDGLALQGRIDRLDVDAAGGRFRVIDYKSRSSRRSLMEEIAELRKLQLPLYLAMAEASSLGGKDAKAAGGALYGIEAEGDGARVESLGSTDFERLRRGLWEDLKEYDRLIAKGFFPIRPEEGIGGHCQYCAYSGACRKAHAPTRARAQRAGL